MAWLCAHNESKTALVNTSGTLADSSSQKKSWACPLDILIKVNSSSRFNAEWCVCVCMYMCMCAFLCDVRMHVCVHVCMCVCICTCAYVFVCVCIPACMHVCEHSCTYICVTAFVHLPMCACRHVCTPLQQRPANTSTPKDLCPWVAIPVYAIEIKDHLTDFLYFTKYTF